MDETTTPWLMGLINQPEVYPDIVEKLIDYKIDGPVVFVIAIDEGNPPIIPLKQIAFNFTYSDDTHQDLLSYEFKLLNPDEVAAGDSRPPQFAAHLPAQYWGAIESEAFWIVEACEGGFCPC